MVVVPLGSITIFSKCMNGRRIDYCVTMYDEETLNLVQT